MLDDLLQKMLKESSTRVDISDLSTKEIFSLISNFCRLKIAMSRAPGSVFDDDDGSVDQNGSLKEDISALERSLLSKHTLNNEN